MLTEIIIFGLAMVGLQFIPELYDHIHEWYIHKKMTPCVDFEDW